MMEIPPQIRLEARKELARRFFYDYCKLRYPRHYERSSATLQRQKRPSQTRSPRRPLLPSTFIGNGLAFPIGFWTKGRTLRIKSMGAYTTPVSSQVTIKVKLGGVTLAQLTTDAFLR